MKQKGNYKNDSRKGSLEWNLETLGKLVIGAIILVFVIYFSFVLIDMFKSDAQTQATASFDVLTRRIDVISKSEDPSNYNGTVILSIPDDYMILGLDSGNGFLPNRPSGCSKSSACICIAQLNKTTDQNKMVNIVPIECKNIPYASISMAKNTEQKNLLTTISSLQPQSRLNLEKDIFLPYVKKDDMILPLAMTNTFRSEGSADSGIDKSKSVFQELQISTRHAGDGDHMILIWKYPAPNQMSLRDLSCTVSLKTSSGKDAESKTYQGFCSGDSKCADVEQNIKLLTVMTPVDVGTCTTSNGYPEGYKCCVAADSIRP